MKSQIKNVRINKKFKISKLNSNKYKLFKNIMKPELILMKKGLPYEIINEISNIKAGIVHRDKFNLTVMKLSITPVLRSVFTFIKNLENKKKKRMKNRVRIYLLNMFLKKYKMKWLYSFKADFLNIIIKHYKELQIIHKGDMFEVKTYNYEMDQFGEYLLSDEYYLSYGLMLRTELQLLYNEVPFKIIKNYSSIHHSGFNNNANKIYDHYRIARELLISKLCIKELELITKNKYNLKKCIMKDSCKIFVLKFRLRDTRQFSKIRKNKTFQYYYDKHGDVIRLICEFCKSSAINEFKKSFHHYSWHLMEEQIKYENYNVLTKNDNKENGFDLPTNPNFIGCTSLITGY